MQVTHDNVDCRPENKFVNKNNKLKSEIGVDSNLYEPSTSKEIKVQRSISEHVLGLNIKREKSFLNWLLSKYRTIKFGRPK